MINDTDEYLKWLRSFVKDKEVIEEVELIQVKEGLNKLFEDNNFIITVDHLTTWESDSTFKNPYNYEITKLDKETNKKK